MLTGWRRKSSYYLDENGNKVYVNDSSNSSESTDGNTDGNGTAEPGTSDGD